MNSVLDVSPIINPYKWIIGYAEFGDKAVWLGDTSKIDRSHIHFDNCYNSFGIPGYWIINGLKEHFVKCDNCDWMWWANQPVESHHAETYDKAINIFNLYRDKLLEENIS